MARPGRGPDCGCLMVLGVIVFAWIVLFLAYVVL